MRHQPHALLAAVGLAAAQGVTEKIAPTAPAPVGCKPTVDGKFEIAIVPLDNKQKREQQLAKKATACSGNGILVAQLSDGIITDALDRTGYIASNYQFQFDGPPQAGAIYTAGFSHCGNGSLALGGSSVFYQCKSGDFYNLYDRWWAEQCSPVKIMVLPCGEGSEVAPAGVQLIVGTTVVPTTVVIPLSDGQPQVITTTKAIPLCQIDDGQVQGHTTPCAAITTTPAHASQYPDGQIQVTPGPPQSGPSVSASIPTPSASGVPNTTSPRTSAPPPPSVVPTNAPPTSNAGRLQLGSAVALAVGIIGALYVL